MRGRRSGRGGAGAGLRPGQGLRDHRRPRRGHGGRAWRGLCRAWSWCPNTPRAVTVLAGRGDRRGLAGAAGRSLPQREADAGRLRRPRPRPPGGPAPRRRGRALHQGAARPAPRGDRDLGRGRGRPRGAAAAAGRRPHPVRQPGRRPLRRHRHRLRLVAGCDGRRRPRPVAARGRPQALQRPRRGAGRRLRARRRLGRRDGAGPQGRRQAPRLLRGAAACRRGGRRRAAERPLRRLWRRLCAGNPRARARAARGGLPRRGRRIPAFQAELDALLANYAGRPTPLTRCRNLGSDAGAHLPEARGPAPRRRAQDQPGARPGPAGEADGQEPADRRDRRRPARGRHRPRRRPVRARDADLHGRARRRAAAGSTSSGWS